MRVQSTGSSAELQQLQRVKQRSGSDQTERSDTTRESKEVSISKPAEMMQKLKSLQESDPGKFKAVVGELASQLSVAADAAGSDEAKARLSKMSDAFKQAAETGNLSGLQPPERKAESRQPSNALEAYKRNVPPPPPKEESVTSAMDAVLAKLQEVSSGSNATQAA